MLKDSFVIYIVILYLTKFYSLEGILSSETTYLIFKEHPIQKTIYHYLYKKAIVFYIKSALYPLPKGRGLTAIRIN